MPKYEVDIYWNCYGTIEVEAPTPDEAQEEAYKIIRRDGFVPSEGMYEGWSADVDWDLEPTESRTVSKEEIK